MISIEVPSWVGDAVMLTPALRNIEQHFDEVMLIGQPHILQLLKGYGTRQIDIHRNSRFRQILDIDIKSDIHISFRKSLFSGLLGFRISKKQFARCSIENFLFTSNCLAISENQHQVEVYLEHLKPILKEIEPFDLELRFQPFKLPTSSVGISAGAAYGSAKRWKAEKFAEVVNRLPADFEVYIFGSNSEVEIANKVASAISGRVVRNLAGKTTIEELVRYIAGMNLFITNDSGPMHIAAAYKVPTVSIFGPTNWRKTSQWKNPNSITIHADLQCAPCMKRVCPLKTDECMKMITADEVLKRIEEKGWIEELF